MFLILLTFPLSAGAVTEKKQKEPIPSVKPTPPPEEVDEQPPVPLPPKGQSPVVEVSKWSKGYCSCVGFARAETGIFTGRIGYAKNHPINSTAPEVGAIIITKESHPKFYTGHVGVVLFVYQDHVLIEEANYRSCRKTLRWLDVQSPLIRGYYIDEGEVVYDEHNVDKRIG